jgi:uncharacterized protein (TIGR02284 family)
MGSANRHDIHVLNGLIRTAIDSADGYRDAAGETDHPGYRALFEQRSFERRRLADELQSTVRSLGGHPDGEGSLLAKAQRAFADLRHALIRDEATVVGAVETVEDAVRSRFERALEDSDISATTRETIRRGWASVRTDHDQVRELKHSLEGQRDASNRLFPH